MNHNSWSLHDYDVAFANANISRPGSFSRRHKKVSGIGRGGLRPPRSARFFISFSASAGDSPLKRSARCSFGPLRKSRQNLRSYVLTKALSGMVLAQAQELSGMGEQLALGPVQSSNFSCTETNPLNFT